MSHLIRIFIVRLVNLTILFELIKYETNKVAVRI